jgi:hypothetical protein
MLDKLPSVLATASFFAIAMVVAHEWAYFSILGSEFQSFYSTSDYLNEFIVWLGPAFVILLVAIAAHGALYRAADFESATPKSRIGRALDNWWQEIIYAISALIALLISNETNRSAVYVLLGLLWTKVTFYVLSHDRFKNWRTVGISLVIAGVPALMMLSYGIGRDSAYKDLQDTKDVYEVHFKNGAPSLTAKVMRVIDKGVLLLNPTTHQLEFRATSELSTLTKSSPTWETRSFVCRHWGWFCK